eukprot:TRINITY_DN1228_c0_g1_i1.p1 TRINITY_DN1228_c0_g1~~TRINITY_DN1228_c0_g1_i1.p1  ORF type:complete len:235 (+),score=25.48 TRINITY_DN1228_c0_g1_i1:238-942(+)
MNGLIAKAVPAESAGSSGEHIEDSPLPHPPSRPDGQALIRQLSTASGGESEDEDHKPHEDFVPGALLPLKQQLELDKEDESLRRWKEQLLGSVELDADHLEPEVQVLTLGILSKGRPEISIPLPLAPSNRGTTFTLKEGSIYSLKFTFVVRHNLVSGLRYINTVWKNGLQVDQSKVMLGTFGPQREAYVQVMDEESTPSGMLARGAYTARTKFVDDDERCHLDVDYTFHIRRDW